ncbi:glycine betaine ABC transporter substrate-binding protein [Lentibacillus sp. Marseille-P4043]|uniref:glycine betaine ABC transporter substrate-binding protein n=1 Tax=Lentibacillus sp. Marseille-P4043 TaxID=2040293 RepID=UPI000D0AC873|nr:glycine betaine ABC transporter substrate-binding protein [Lentibacillus sp. Marseille-P4043]
MFKKLRFLGLTAALVLAITLAACGGGDSEESSDDDSGNTGGSDNGVELGEKELTVPYVAWAGAVARTELIGQVLEEVGYDVELKQVEAGPMWSSVADGSADFTAAAWLPATHQSYWEKYQDDLVNVNQVIDKAPLALTVPSYMEDVNSIEDLKGNDELGESVDWQIVGIDPGAGIMQNTEKALKNYGLDKWELTSSSEAAMLSELQSKMENEEPIIVPLWKPHWAFAEMDLKMLEDPDEIYGGDGDHIDIVANKDFEEKSPAAYKVLEQFSSDYELLDSLMGPIHNGEEPADVISKFLDENQDLVDEWTKGVTE